MLVSPDDVRVRGKYEQTPAGMQEFINDQLLAHIWVIDDTHSFRVPTYLCTCCGPDAWAEMVRAYKSTGWRVFATISAFTRDRAHYVELYFTKEQ